MKIPDEERVDDACEYMSNLAQTYLPLKRWGFKESYRSKEDKRLIIDSQWCRIKFVWGGWDMQGGNTISIYYGRSHAPNNEIRMNWNEEECHCWHREELALHFLDGTMPDDAAKSIYTHKVIELYKESVIGQSLGGKRRQPEWLVRMQASIWEEYAPRLFEVFDLHRPELWGKYRQFLKEVYDIKGRSSFIKPAMDIVC
jgi:hypothetical protein